MGDAKYGIDFAGGTDIVAAFKDPVRIGDVRAALEKAGFGEATVQAFQGKGKDNLEFSIRVRSEQKSDTGKRIRDALQTIPGNTVNILQEDYVGPIIGEQIRRDGLIAFFLSLLGILVFISFRFESRFAIGAIIALFHDAVIAAGIYVFFGYEVSAGLLAAILTICGFSVHDTIIVFDRIRENMTLAYKQVGDKKKAKKQGEGKDLSQMTLAEIMNLSINQTLSRTILTSVTAVLVSLTLWYFATGAVSELCFALTVGIIVGTYSSIYIASPIVLLFEREHV